jgi:AcrR family transcriptional regulator
MASPGRPRSETARIAVLHAVDDLLVEQGYAAMSMKSIAERAGVSRQTLYRWWSNKAEVLLEASHVDSQKRLAPAPDGTLQERLASFLEAVVAFLFDDPAGITWRVLLGDAQHDAEVASVIHDRDPFERPAIDALVELGLRDERVPAAVETHLLVGPVVAASLQRDRETTLDVARLTAQRMTVRTV